MERVFVSASNKRKEDINVEEGMIVEVKERSLPSRGLLISTVQLL